MSNIVDEQEIFSAEQVAYLIHLAFQSGIRYQATHAQAEMLACWAEHHETPPTREERIAAEVAAGGPVKYHGGDISQALLAEWENHITKQAVAR